MSIADLRKEYTLAGLDVQDVDTNPLVQLERWLKQAIDGGANEPTAMTLATATKEGRPSARIVLLKGIESSGLVFFTNYESRKGRELLENPHAALLFFWPELERQIRVEGVIEKISHEDSDTYYRSRPVASRQGAWASKQSSVIDGRHVIEQKVAEVQKVHGDDPPLPPFWGGYRLTPNELEFWQGRPSRLHDRLRFRRADDASWRIERLSP
ncbi:MAG: pyridoxamine 5'-phosphate oxidase [Polyangiaceae bacterium]